MVHARRIVIDPTRCRGHGTCATLLPANLRLDRWHYPLVVDPMVDPDDPGVRLAVQLCPELAFSLEPERPGR